ncbi:uncharacterized protein LOC135923974 [Gordionus sp. m RMFG-2023]|uniref:uncharacterized protein LOC135923974 n=1 Tax=Gordionus sp. m RMFG-2023 TaxID=3053472 RepID=UPI0031FC545D
MALNPLESKKNIYNKVLGDRLQKVPNINRYPDALPTYQTVQKSMDRMVKQARPNLPKTSMDLILPIEFTLCEGQPFLLGNHNNEILIFSTYEFIKILTESDTVYMDGTFFIAPNIYQQLYSVHVYYKEYMLVVIYGLLSNKRKSTYIKLFIMIKEICEKYNCIWAPKFVQLDFEQAAIEALHKVFLKIQIKGCFFHYTQCIWRKINTLLLKSLYNEDPMMRTIIKRMCVLPLLNPQDINDVALSCQILATTNNLPIDNFFLYMDKTWLGNNSMFPREMWSRYGTSGPRTNNHLEGWHSALNKSTRSSHPNIYTFINLIQKDHIYNKLKKVQLDLGMTTKKLIINI